MKNLIVLGSVNSDHVLRVSRFPEPGETVAGNDYDLFDGGKGANQAVSAVRLGAETSFVACVGDDEYGKAVTKRFNCYGIDISGVASVPGHRTGSAMIFVDQNGENSIGIASGANACLTKEFLMPLQERIASAEILLMQLETPLSGIAFAAEIAKRAGARTILNPAPVKSLPDDLLQMVDIITPNQSEAETLTGVTVDDEDSASQAANELHGKGIPVVIITLGRKGVWFSEKRKGKLIPGFRVKTRDTTGAGDCFNGALAAGLQQLLSYEGAINLAQAAAALSVMKEGAQSSLPDRKEVDSFIVSNAMQ